MPEGEGRTDPGSLKGTLFRGESGGDPGIYNFNDHGKLKRGHFDADSMTIGELQRLQSEGKINAAGKYQIIPSTLKEAILALHLQATDKFDSMTQDRIYTDWLANKKRPQIRDYIIGKSDNLDKAHFATAQEWASVDWKEASLYGGHNKGIIADETIRSALQRTRALYQRLTEQGFDPETARRAALLGIENPTNVHPDRNRVSLDHHTDVSPLRGVMPNNRFGRAVGSPEVAVPQIHAQSVMKVADRGLWGMSPAGTLSDIKVHAASTLTSSLTGEATRDAERAVLTRPRPSVVSTQKYHALVGSVDFDHGPLLTAIGHVNTLHRKLQGLKTVASVEIHHTHRYEGEVSTSGTARSVLNGNFGSDGRSFN